MTLRNQDPNHYVTIDDEPATTPARLSNRSPYVRVEPVTYYRVQVNRKSLLLTPEEADLLKRELMEQVR